MSAVNNVDVKPRTDAGKLPLVSVLKTEQWSDFDKRLFEGSDQLEKLRDYARAAGVSPVGFLCTTLVHLASISHPLTVDVGLEPTPLNLMLALVGDSGAGKDMTLHKARGAYTFTRNGQPVECLEYPLGSGESLPSVYCPPVDPKRNESPSRVHHALFVDTEVSSVGVLMGRQGSTLRSMLLKQFIGSSLGNGTKQGSAVVQGGTYSAGVVIGVQPGKAGILLDDAEDGFPQRFLWTELVDPFAPLEMGKLPKLNSVELPPPGTVIHGCPEAVTVFNGQRLRRVHGHTDGVNSHVKLIRARIAALLAILREHATTGFDDDDWERAGLLVDYSKRVREYCVEQVENREIDRQLDRTEQQHARFIVRAKGLIVRALEKDERVERAPLRRKAKSVIRSHYDDVLEEWSKREIIKVTAWSGVEYVVRGPQWKKGVEEYHREK